jgi:hypothetical protein
MLSLDETLETLRNKGVRSASFHADGSLAAVQFEPTTPAPSDTETPQADDIPEPYRNALEILSGGGRTRQHAEAE